ncbi:response regulator [Hymenobacter sp. HMF4947]|uniref:Response regulator n=1 Tax=Hymenobacter ginkgonis TaxID=2682976 RepID=A0A7K1TK68_9BACT|nr:response regulator [Hymenobacter ginkgonis]
MVSGRQLAVDGRQLLVEALHLLVPPRPLLVLLDLQMPVMDGLAFLAHQCQLSLAFQQTMTVIVLTAAHESEQQVLVQ